MGWERSEKAKVPSECAAGARGVSSFEAGDGDPPPPRQRRSQRECPLIPVDKEWDRLVESRHGH